MHRRLVSYAILPLLTISGIFFQVYKAEAVTVGPPKIEISADPGDTFEGKILLINEEDKTRTFYPSFQKFIEVDGERKFIDSEPTELANWFRVTKSITLEPQEQTYVPFSIELPKNAPPGGHFAIIWWSTGSSNEESGSSIVTRAGIVVYLRVSGDIQEVGSIKLLDTRGEGRLLGGLPKGFSLVFKNEGNVHLKPTGEVVIRNLFRQKVASAPINPGGLGVLPQSEKTFSPELGKTRWGGFAFGLYFAEAKISYGTSGEISKKLIFFAIPWKFILSAIIGIAVLAFALTRGISKYNKWIIEKAGNPSPKKLGPAPRQDKIVKPKKSTKLKRKK